MFPHSKTRALSFFLLVILLFVPIAGAVSNADNIKAANLYKAPKSSTTEPGLFSELSAKAELYNQNLNEVPAVFKKLVANEKIAGKIQLENGKMLYVTVVMKGVKVKDIYTYNSPNDPKLKSGPSVTVETDEKTVRTVLDSEDPFEAALQGVSDGSIKVTAEGFLQNTALWTSKHLNISI